MTGAHPIADAFEVMNYGERLRAALDVVQGSTDARLEQLGFEDACALLEPLTANPMPGQEVIGARNRMLAVLRLDDDFLNAQIAITDRLSGELETLPQARRLREGWAALSTDRKLAALTMVAQRHCQLLGIDPPEVGFFNGDPEAEAPFAEYVQGPPPRIAIAAHPNAPLDDFPVMIGLLVHENTHHFQQTLIHRLIAGRIKPGDKAYRAAVLFEMNMRKGGMARPGGRHDPSPAARLATQAYERQPVEVHADRCQRRIVSRLDLVGRKLSAMATGRGRAPDSRPQPPRR
jgi:hypothetical protein